MKNSNIERLNINLRQSRNMSISKKDLDELKPWIDRTVQKFLGFNEPALVTAAFNCLSCGYDRKKTKDKLASLLEESKASRLADKLFETLDDLKVKAKSRKRHKDDGNEGNESKKPKKLDEMETARIPPPPPMQPSPGQLSALQIKEMMANAQKMIEERKKALNQIKFDTSAAKLNTTVKTAAPVEGTKQQKIAELQAQIQAKLSTRPGLLGSVPTVQLPPPTVFVPPNMMHMVPLHEDVNTTPKTPTLQSKPTPLILDSEGRTVDLTGKEVQLTQRMPTLKANIRAKKREQFKISQEKVQEEIVENKYFDMRVAAKAAGRTKRAFKFHEKGRFEQLAQRLRTKAQLEKLQQEIAQAAKKTGITSATKLALIAPKRELKEDEIPEVEWWDSVILRNDTYDIVIDKSASQDKKFEGVTTLIEHPTQMKAPTESNKPDFLPVYLTKKEHKKLRRQNRREAWRDKQEKIRLGLEPPPEAKVKMANLMRVLGTEAVQDPTKIEAHVRAQMAKRQKAHEEANAARKLTVDQKRDKKIRKIKEDTSLGVHVTVYRVGDLSNPSKKFKVETNANQLFLTGCVVLYRDCNVIVVEGGPKQQKKFKRLMLNRIKWSEEIVKKSEESIPNKCVLVWEGTSKRRHFNEMKFKVCPMESLAREHFKKLGVEHYWDSSYSGSILEAAEET